VTKSQCDCRATKGAHLLAAGSCRNPDALSRSGRLTEIRTRLTSPNGRSGGRRGREHLSELRREPVKASWQLARGLGGHFVWSQLRRLFTVAQRVFGICPSTSLPILRMGTCFLATTAIASRGRAESVHAGPVTNAAGVEGAQARSSPALRCPHRGRGQKPGLVRFQRADVTMPAARRASRCLPRRLGPPPG
jgi:hypothetical protein